jgi:Ca2+/H+ antiporter
MGSHHFLFEEEENEEKQLLRAERQQSIELGAIRKVEGRRPRGNSQENRPQLLSQGSEEEGEEKEPSSPRPLLETVKNPLTTGVSALRVAQRGRETSADSGMAPGKVNRTDEELAETANEENNNDDDDDDDDEDEDVLGVRNSIIWLCIVSILISFLSDAIVDTIEDAANGTNISNVFLAAIVVPIVGNAAEHTSAVVFGIKNRLNLALAIAVGSATQIGLFLLPVVVLLGWMAGLPMGLNYEGYEVLALTMSVILVGFVLAKGRSTWLDGVTLIGAYAIICGGFGRMVPRQIYVDA